MSYEGYYQLLCANGHANGSIDAYSFDDKLGPCACGAPVNQHNSVDETNGCEGDPCICGARELVEIEPAQTETCNLGHAHVVKPARYEFGPVLCHTNIVVIPTPFGSAEDGQEVEAHAAKNHDAECSCPGAQKARHQAGMAKPTDDPHFPDCNCQDCLDAFEDIQ